MQPREDSYRLAGQTVSRSLRKVDPQIERDEYSAFPPPAFFQTGNLTAARLSTAGDICEARYWQHRAARELLGDFGLGDTERAQL